VDHVDEVSHRVGELLLLFPTDVRPVVHRWQRSDDRWLRRASVICQIGARERTDRHLLTEAIDANAADHDFFLRKAIGWALRDYARTDPEWVRAFVVTHDLSPLSVREATKHL
jgi:3-methyladenine DNA glycosylase AlkD